MRAQPGDEAFRFGVGGFYTIGPNERAVVTTFGRAQRVGNATTIDDRDQWMVQGNTMGGVILSLYFDQETGLLTRSVRYTESPVGRIPTQIDYSDYRDVNGVKLHYLDYGTSGRRQMLCALQSAVAREFKCCG